MYCYLANILSCSLCGIKEMWNLFGLAVVEVTISFHLAFLIHFSCILKKSHCFSPSFNSSKILLISLIVPYHFFLKLLFSTYLELTGFVCSYTLVGVHITILLVYILQPCETPLEEYTDTWLLFPLCLCGSYIAPPFLFPDNLPPGTHCLRGV